MTNIATNIRSVVDPLKTLKIFKVVKLSLKAFKLIVTHCKVLEIFRKIVIFNEQALL